MRPGDKVKVTDSTLPDYNGMEGVIAERGSGFEGDPEYWDWWVKFEDMEDLQGFDEFELEVVAAPAEQPAPEPEPRGAASVGAWTLPSEMVTPEVKAVFERQQAALEAERARVRALEANERQYREIVTEFADELIGINTHTMTGADALALLTRLHRVAVAMRKATASANGGGE